jgi:hypothetical protein
MVLGVSMGNTDDERFGLFLVQGRNKISVVSGLGHLSGFSPFPVAFEPLFALGILSRDREGGGVETVETERLPYGFALRPPEGPVHVGGLPDGH